MGVRQVCRWIFHAASIFIADYADAVPRIVEGSIKIATKDAKRY